MAGWAAGTGDAAEAAWAWGGGRVGLCVCVAWRVRVDRLCVCNVCVGYGRRGRGRPCRLECGSDGSACVRGRRMLEIGGDVCGESCGAGPFCCGAGCGGEEMSYLRASGPGCTWLERRDKKRTSTRILKSMFLDLKGADQRYPPDAREQAWARKPDESINGQP